MKNLLSAAPLLLSLCWSATVVALQTQGQPQQRKSVKKQQQASDSAVKPNIHDVFDQYESTRFLNRDMPATADWAHVPWASSVSSINHISRDSNAPFAPISSYFMVGVGEDSEFWVAAETNLGNPQPGAFTQLQMPAALNHTYEDSSPSPMLRQWVISELNGNMFICRLPNVAAGFDTAICGTTQWVYFPFDLATTSVLHVKNISSSASTDGQVFPLRQMAIEYSIDHPELSGTPRAPKNLYFASQGGLTFVPFSPSISGDLNATARPATLTNTTGGRHNNTNVTSVWCFPSDVPVRNFNASARPDAWHQGQCYVGTANQVCLHNVCPPNLVHRVLDGQETYFYRTPGVIDRLPNGLAYDAQRNAVHMGNDKCLNLLYANDSLWRVDGKTGGLPMNKIKSVSQGGGGNIWYGTEQGVNVMLPDGKWRYFYGPRWLPVRPGLEEQKGNFVVAMAAGRGVTLVATKVGLSVIHVKNTSLEAKASEFQQQHDEYHDRFGLSTWVTLNSFGNKTSWVAGPTANDGLWSSIYLHGQAFRYAAETDPVLKAEAKHNAKKTFAGMKMLFNVTGIKGYPARGFIKSVTKPKHSPQGNLQWQPSPTMPGYWFLSQTSSDEVTGHMSAYPIYHDLVCETQAEKDEVKTLIGDLVSRIVDLGLNMVGEDGHPTMWGRWGVDTVNNDPFYYDERGTNALEILSILSNAYRITKNETYASVFVDLVENHGYAESAVDNKITQVSDVSSGDDELAFLAYLGLLWSSNLVVGSNSTPGASSPKNKLFAKVQYDVLISIQRTFHYKQVYGERSNWWNSVYVGYMKTLKPGGLSASEEEFLMGAKTGAVFSFQTWSASWINWPVDNSHRLDIVLNPHTEDVTAMEDILPFDETPLLVWNESPYTLARGNGMTLMDPSAWLTPYWTARYFGLFNVTKG